ncbi:hypothetical protein SteCoe_22253 [Stentor coeruleus]|uniref:Uncharacterized protein n=1 Tax=Stentor coeruleus TaxID=5963 RepID=A0A1R2BMY0_9CILI|nr:hypothetical protein SteCoe_22253 [Stentor coeruleus]
MKKIFSFFKNTSTQKPSYQELLSSSCKTFNYKIFGTESQLLEINLSPYQGLTISPSSLLYMDQGISMSTSTISGSKSALQRVLSGSSFFLVQMFNENPKSPAKVAVGASSYSKILSFDIGKYPQGLYFVNSSYLCSSIGVAINARFKGTSVSLVEQSLFMQKFAGHGDVFVKGGVNPRTLYLTQDQSVVISSESLLGFTDGININLRKNLHPQNIVTGKNFLLLELTGPGEVFMQNTSQSAYETSLVNQIAESSIYPAIYKAYEIYWSVEDEKVEENDKDTNDEDVTKEHENKIEGVKNEDEKEENRENDDEKEEDRVDKENEGLKNRISAGKTGVFGLGNRVLEESVKDENEGDYGNDNAGDDPGEIIDNGPNDS